MLPALAVTLGACSGPQSMLDPAGPAAQTAVQITWVLFVGAALVWLLMLCLLAWTMHRRRRTTLRRPGPLIVIGGLAFPTVVLFALLLYGTAAGRLIVAADEQVDLVVQVTGVRWHWRFDYLDDDGNVVARSVDRLQLPLGAMTEFQVGSADVIHSFWIPRLGGKIDAIPGRINRLRLRPTRTGAMSGQCAEFCGLRHAHMRFAVDVVEPDVFAGWLAAQADTAAGNVPAGPAP